MATPPSKLIARLLGEPSIPLAGNIGMLDRLRLNLERHALRRGTDVMTLIAKELATPRGKRALLAAIAAGGALGGGSLAWTLAKNSPQGPSRLANALERALFADEPEAVPDVIQPEPEPEVITPTPEEEMPWGQYGMM